MYELISYVPLESLIAAGYTPAELSDHDVQAQDLARVTVSLDSFELADLKDVRDVDAGVLRDFGWQAADLMKAGFTSYDLLDAGYSSRQVTSAEASSAAAAASANGPGSGDGSTGTVAAVVVVLLLVVGAAVWFIVKRGSSTNETVPSFENPMYDTSGPVRGASMRGLGLGGGTGAAGQESSYMDVNPLYNSAGGDDAGTNNTTGYMDVPPNQNNMANQMKIVQVYGDAQNSDDDNNTGGFEERATAGYMDVAAGNQSGGYMDVSPNQPNSRQDDTPASDEEEV